VKIQHTKVKVRPKQLGLAALFASPLWALMVIITLAQPGWVVDTKLYTLCIPGDWVAVVLCAIGLCNAEGGEAVYWIALFSNCVFYYRLVLLVLMAVRESKACPSNEVGDE